MKKIAVSVVLFGVISLAGCSSTGSLPEQVKVDQEYVKDVERASRRASHAPRIYWVNPPVKKTPKTEAPSH
ncbi:hypothetical protein [Alishewanella tabrizica]|uniref:Lipoprotein n=1 Tax=Alishewanella tabrizica TaxID=671278 RepID=A0ABQ2WU33_9ALTE|nr:hypothetical protein [Alishewanella tabrizica]GGW68721.1 hypothetical protein GCM10008111_25930 [Alishewanella tabrizica]